MNSCSIKNLGIVLPVFPTESLLFIVFAVWVYMQTDENDVLHLWIVISFNIYLVNVLAETDEYEEGRGCILKWRFVRSTKGEL